MTEADLKRYSRHILLQEIGEEGQQKIHDASVLIIGTGGLGSPVALYLAAAGVGNIGIVDGDVVDLSNLQRQVIHFTTDVGKPKVESARDKILAINPKCNVIPHKTFLTPDNALDIVSSYDFIVDCTDNFSAKYLVNDTCVMAGKAFNHGSILHFEGQTFTHVPGSACYRCLFNTPPSADHIAPGPPPGVLGVIPGIVGTIQATEALKYITGVGRLLTNQLLTFEAKTMDFRRISVSKNPHCTLCNVSQKL